MKTRQVEKNIAENGNKLRGGTTALVCDWRSVVVYDAEVPAPFF